MSETADAPVVFEIDAEFNKAIWKFLNKPGLRNRFTQTKETYRKRGHTSDDSTFAALEELYPERTWMQRAWPDGVMPAGLDTALVESLARFEAREAEIASGEEEVADQLTPRGGESAVEYLDSMTPAALAKLPANANSVKEVEWVAANLSAKAVDRRDAPSRSAIGLLEWARSSPGARSQFWKDMYKPLLPSRSEREAMKRFEDDGAECVENIDRILKESAAPE